ncbi:MFS transporter [Kocuria carniphila]|uniref:MFS transporter n=1 Tax=Kocuria carniphila TaxID=262208 RepID=UPI000DB5223D|nr:MFS transporter [Kocuria carniphila]MCT1803516.1 MFS transporter [Kocuria carniphila]PZP20272.1 MAG: MFS transporter [Kocuria rhizophila]
MADSPSGARSSAWLWLLVACAVLTQSTVNLLRPVTSYKLLALQADSVTIGLTTAAYALVPLFTAVWLGRYSDRAPQLKLLTLAGVGLLVAGGSLLAASPTVWAIVAASVVLGMGHLCFTIGGQAAIARYAADRDLDKGFGWFTAAFSAGQMIGPALGGWLVGQSTGVESAERLADVNQAMWIGTALSLFAVPLLIFRFKAPRSTTSRPGQPRTGQVSQVSAEKPTVVGVLKVPRVASHMLAALSLLAMLDILTAFLPVIGEEAGVAPAVVGLLLGVRGLASIASRILLPWLSMRFSRRSLLLTCLFGAGITLIIPPLFIQHFWIAAALLAVGGFLLGLGQPLTMTMITTSVPSNWRGSALAVRLTGNRLGQVVLPLLAGVFAAPLGPAAAVWMCCGVLLISGAEKAWGDKRSGRS